ncbi:GNAT family N-acetyltransferase [Oenococcus alcoholitolerans]|uniref:N-acetyltransferase GCN5 n=1 Tax=Oenococcus alcoholitolerans TaxID=931074 RepID=A0ABR4XNY9_9LACO|nr:N-acetyltransferase GCN5 [Oenococcus alcoholitolerans]
MTKVYIRKATIYDIDRMVQLIDQGKKLLADQGIPQWQKGYPRREDLLEDIKRSWTYLLIFDQDIVGTATIFQLPDPNYADIYQGKWQGDPQQKYATIHRITIDPHFSGNHLGDYFFSDLISEAYRLGYRQLRIDTHVKNKRMQHLAAKFSFDYAGIIYLDHDDTDQRNAYQLFLS